MERKSLLVETSRSWYIVNSRQKRNAVQRLSLLDHDEPLPPLSTGTDSPVKVYGVVAWLRIMGGS